MAPENGHLYYINKSLININIPRYKLFRNVSLKLSSLNKSSYEWSRKAIVGHFFSSKKLIEIYRHNPEKQTKTILMKTEYLIHVISNFK